MHNKELKMGNNLRLEEYFKVNKHNYSKNFKILISNKIFVIGQRQPLFNINN